MVTIEEKEECRVHIIHEKLTSQMHNAQFDINSIPKQRQRGQIRYYFYQPQGSRTGIEIQEYKKKEENIITSSSSPTDILRKI